MQMTKKILMCVGLALLIWIPVRAWPGANLVLSETRIDFGNMVEGVVAEKVIKLSNTGDQPLKITNITTS